MTILTYSQPDAFYVTFEGKFTFADHEPFRRVLEQLSQAGQTKVIMQMKAMEFVDSAGMGMLLLARDEADKHKKQLIIAGAVGQPKKMFDLANFQNFFAFVP